LLSNIVGCVLGNWGYFPRAHFFSRVKSELRHVLLLTMK
jgi:hypothetical protein